MIELVECTLQSRRICVASDIAMFQQEKAMMFIHLPDLLKLLSRLGERQDKVTHQGAVGGAACMIVGPPEGSFYVTCKKAAMYGKRMRDVHIAGFTVKSDAVIRFRTRDGKVAVADLLVGVGRYPSVKNAQEAIFNLMNKNDGKLSDLDSIEIDKELFDQKVCTFSNYLFFCTMAEKSAMVPNKFKYFCTTIPSGIVVQNKIPGTKSNLIKFEQNQGIIRSKGLYLFKLFIFLYHGREIGHGTK